MIDRLDRSETAHTLPEHAAYLASRRIAGVQHAPDAVGGLAPERQTARRVALDRVPHSISSRTYAGPSEVRTSTASSSHRPSPARIVSAACSAGESSSPIAAAMPPCA